MAKKAKWLSMAYFVFVILAIFLVISIVFLKKKETVSPVTLNLVPRSKTGVVLAFELNDILLTIDTKKMIQQIGFSRAMSYARSKKIGLSDVGAELSQIVYVTLHKVSENSVSKQNQVSAQASNQTPDCIRDWQAGRQSGSELKKIVLQKIEEHPEWFVNTLEQEIVSLLISNMLTPELFVSTLKIVPSGLDALVRYKNKNHTIIAFFNSDSDTFALLKETFPELFSLFDKIIVSCDTHQIKPDKKAYNFFLDRKKEYGETIILVEAEKNQYKAALSYGLESVLIPSKPGFLGLSFYPDFTVLDKKLSD